MTSIFIVVYENQFRRNNMDDFISSPIGSFFDQSEALNMAKEEADKLHLIKSDSYDDTWYDPEEGAHIIYVTEIRPI